jgi:hypothetical protein
MPQIKRSAHKEGVDFGSRPRLPAGFHIDFIWISVFNKPQPMWHPQVYTRELKSKHQAVRQGAARCGTRSNLLWL